MLRYAPPAITVDRAQPLTVVTYWQQFGAFMWVALALAIAIASIGYVGVLLKTPPVRMTLAVSALACAAALLFPVVFSSDVYAYAGYGDMALHGINPYGHLRITLRDTLLDAMQWQWGNPPPMSVYGPVFVALAQAVVAIFLPFGAAAPLWALRILACIALVACAPLAYAAFSAFPRSTRLAAAAGIALNPIAIWSAAEGHNDAFALAIVLAGFALVARGRTFTGVLIATLSALVKAPGALAAIAFTALSWRDSTRLRAAAAGTALGLAVTAGFMVPLEYGVQTHLAPQGHYFPQFSLQYVSIGLTAAIAVLLVTACFERRMTTGERAIFLAFAAWLAIPNPYPWYALWLLPLAFLAWRSFASWAVIAASLLMTLRYYPDATTDLSRPLSLAIVALQFGIPLFLLSVHMVSVRRRLPEIQTTVPGFATPRLP